MNKMPFDFTGALQKVVIELGKSGLASADEKELKESTDRAWAAAE